MADSLVPRESFRETKEEQVARVATGFPDMEKKLPHHIGSRWNIPFFDNVSSFFGHRNVLAKEVNPANDVVWLLDNTAYRPVREDSNSLQLWEAEFVVAYFTKDSGKDVSAWVAEIASRIGLREQGDDRAGAEATIAKRLIPFVNTIQPARFMHVRFPDSKTQKLGPGGRNAISSGIVGPLGKHNDGESLEITAAPPEIAPHGSMLMHFAQPQGWTVISGELTDFLQASNA